jgi:hypothetical protein
MHAGSTVLLHQYRYALVAVAGCLSLESQERPAGRPGLSRPVRVVAGQARLLLARCLS